MDNKSLIDDISSEDPLRVSQALQAAGPQKESLTEDVLSCLRTSLEALKGGVRTTTFSPVFLLYLTAAWREVRAYPLLIEMLQLPEEDMDWMLGDVVTEDSSIILADTYPGDAGSLHSLISDQKVYGFARGAGIRTLAVLTHRGVYSREKLVQDFTALGAALDPESESDQITAVALVDALLDLRLWELRGLALRLYDRELVGESFIGLDEIEKELAPAHAFEPPASSLTATITDAWKAVEHWHFFSPLKPESLRRLPMALRPDPSPERIVHHPESPSSPPQPYIAPVKPGRNDPCSCGSGKKYKKCCGA